MKIEEYPHRMEELLCRIAVCHWGCLENMSLRALTRKVNRNAPLALLAPLALGRKII